LWGLQPQGFDVRVDRKVAGIANFQEESIHPPPEVLEALPVRPSHLHQEWQVVDHPMSLSLVDHSMSLSLVAPPSVSWNWDHLHQISQMA